MNLKSCPFCGVALEEHPWKKGSFYHPAAKKSCPADRVTFDADYIETWNTRASPWITVSEPPKEGQKVFVRVAMSDGIVVFYWATFEKKVWTENFDDAIIPTKWITHWQPIAKIIPKS